MRLLTWNIRHGGGRRIPDIIEAISAYNCDVAVLTEFRHDAAGRRLMIDLEGMGYTSSFAPASSHERSNGVMVASKFTLEACGTISNGLDKANALCTVKVSGFEVVGAYLPVGPHKTPYWDRLLEVAKGEVPQIILGDFNTGRHYLDENGATLVSAAYMDRMEEKGLIDVFRSRNPTARVSSWYSSYGNGFRLDHVFASRAVDRLVADVSYDHSVRERGVSDHSALIVDLEPLPATTPVSN